MVNEPQGQERRQSVRISRNFILRFFLKDNPAVNVEISQVENISRGGICFTSVVNFKKGDVLTIELRTPYITDVILLDGVIVSILEKVKGLIFENHVQFQHVTAKAAVILEKIERFNSKAEAK